MSDDKFVMNLAYDIGNAKDDKPKKQSDGEDTPWYVCLLGFFGFTTCC